MTVMPRTTVTEVLACLEDEFTVLAEAFTRGEYVLWLGSGISRDVVPAVPTLLAQMLEFVRESIDPSDPQCRFRLALSDVLDVANVPAAIRASIDLASPVATWRESEDIIARLVDRYADVLNVQVRGEPEDFLLWTALDVTATYGAPGLEPDVEHYCVALLMLEGVVRSAPTANWDGLVESAMDRLVDDAGRFLRVVVSAADFRATDRPADLVKFHGCAVRAAHDEAEYRSRLVARTPQISGWTTRPENELVKNHLEHLYTTRAALFIGLSAQDADIHTVLNQAIQNLHRDWPHSPPAVVFAEQQLHHHHRHVLQVTYQDKYAAHRDAIEASALLGAYAKPALVGLVLLTLSDKLCALVECVSELSLDAGDLERLRTDIRDLRDVLASLADTDARKLVEAVVSGLAFAMTVFRSGATPDPSDLHYQPVSLAPIVEARANPDFPSPALGRFAVAISLLGRGTAAGIWSLTLGTPAQPSEGVVRVATARRTLRLFMVNEQRSLARLIADGVVDPSDEDALVIQATAVLPPLIRSPRARYGRTGVARFRRVDLETLCASVNTADELFETFRLEGAL